MMVDEKVFKDVVHGYVRVRDELIWDLIQTPVFQRMHRIKQLGGTYVVYPTAEHSRFSHSLGVYELTRRIVGILMDQGYVIDDETRMLVLVAALLHDVGHGPFSHSFESVLGVSHENFTCRILQEDAEVHCLLEGYSVGFSQKVSDVISKSYGDELIVSLVSSQLDADRLDYLLRDSYFTGTPYGEIDLDRILRTIRVSNGKIVFKASGMHAIEDYLLSRYQMFWQVYLHDCSQSFDFLIKSLLGRVRKLIETGYEFRCDVGLFRSLFEGDAVGVVPLDVYLRFDDGMIMTYTANFLAEEDAILCDLADRLLNRRLLDEFEYARNEASVVILKDISKNLGEMGIDVDSYFFNDCHERSPYDYYGLGDETIDLLMSDGSIREISSVSDIIKGLVNSSKKKSTVFLPLDLIEASGDGEMREKILEKLYHLGMR